MKLEKLTPEDQYKNICGERITTCRDALDRRGEHKDAYDFAISGVIAIGLTSVILELQRRGIVQ